jgi:hypothetical protein
LRYAAAWYACCATITSRSRTGTAYTSSSSGAERPGAIHLPFGPTSRLCFRQSSSTFRPDQQQSIIEAWIDRGTRGAAARWLKATAQVPALFDQGAVAAYWRASEDDRAAKRLANQAAPSFLSDIVAELADRCEQGWIVSKAAMRAETVRDAVWPTIRSKHPATYLYLCARLRRNISETEALDLVLACPNEIMNETRGLAIWAVGQMGMIRVLDQVVERGEELSQKDLDAFNRFPG